MKLLTQNSDLKKSGIYGWTIPAHWTMLKDGSQFNTCPNAGVCAAFCYAKSGTYQFRNVRDAHREKLDLVLNHRSEWKAMMKQELSKKKYDHRFIRIHDAGDFFNLEYALDWIEISNQFPSITFYTYTKEVSLFKTLTGQGSIPSNFIIIYSYGGKQDHLIEPEVDRHSDVFPDYQAMIDAGYIDIADDDSMAATSQNHRIGLYRNNIPHFVKRQGDQTFREWSQKKKYVKSEMK